MQTFKEIPYQNYIELKFNTKSLHEAQKQEAMIKYKRNSQILAEIFTFHQPASSYPPQAQTIPQCIILVDEETILQYRQQVLNQKQQSANRLQKLKQQSQLYEQSIKSIGEIKTKDELLEKIEQLKKLNFYDDKHPFFVEGSPFFGNGTDDQIREVTNNAEQSLKWEQLSLLQLD